jgi:succinoglycan biosynthesis transport protein ExoP
MPSPQEQHIQIDYLPNLQDIVMTIWRHRKTMIITMVAITMLGLLGLMFKTNTYNSSAIIMIKDNSVNLQDFKEFTDTPKFDTMTVMTEVKILLSPTLALRTIEATKLYDTDEFRSFNGDAKGSLAKFMKSLRVSQQGATKIIEVTFNSKDPELAAKVANAHINSYFMSQIDGKTKRVTDLSTWFEGRVKVLKEDVIAKSKAAAEYRASKKLVVGQDDQELIYQQINDVSSRIGTVQTQKLDTDSKISAVEALKDKANPDAIASIVNSGLIQKLKTDVSGAAQEVALLRGKFGPHHPAVLAASHKLGQAKASLRDETLKIKDTLKSDSIAAQAEIDMLKNHLAQLEKDASEMRSTAIIYEGLRLEEKTSQKLLDGFLASFESLQSQDNLAKSDAVIISPAVATSFPSGPSKKVMLLAILIFSGVVGLGIVFAMEVMRGGISNFEDIRKFGYKPLGIIPDVPNPITSAQNPHNSTFKEALKRVYMTGLLPSKAQSILITSAVPKEGRTTFAVTMAQYMLSIGHKVIVIDTDFMNPTNYFGNTQSQPIGLSDYLTSTMTLDSIISTDQAGMSFIHAGSIDLPPPNILNSPRFIELLQNLKARYNYVIIDSSPLLAHAEAEAIARHADGTIIIAEWMKTSHANISNIAVTLKQMNVNVLGIVMNKVDIDKYKTFTDGSDFLLPNISQADFK